MHDTFGGTAGDASWRTPATPSGTTAFGVGYEPANGVGAFIRMVAPPPSLAGLVEVITIAATPEHVAARLSLAQLPHAGAQVVFAIEQGSSLPGSRPIGAGQRASLLVMPAHLRLTPLPAIQRQLVAASLHPTGSRLVAPRGTGELMGPHLLPLQTFWGDAALDLLDRLVCERSLHGRLLQMMRAFEARVPVVGRPHSIARQGTELLVRARGAISLSAVATSCRCTLRTLYAAVVAETGLRPKHLARILRLRHAIDLLATGSGLNEAAAQAEYSDQAHMSREFRALLYQSPRSFARRLQGAGHPDFPLTLPAHRPITDTGWLMTLRPGGVD